MEIKIVSDTHNDAHQIKSEELSCDVLIHCGDFGTKGNFTEAYDFFYWFVKQPAKYKLFVPGNHDKRYKKSDELVQLTNKLGLVDLSNNFVEIEGKTFWGCNFVPQVNKAGITLNSPEPGQVSSMPRGLDMLVTHAPPRYILDSNREGIACGSQHILEEMLLKQPKYHVFGHIHEQGGESARAGATELYNCAVKDRAYNTVRGPVTILL